MSSKRTTRKLKHKRGGKHITKTSLGGESNSIVEINSKSSQTSPIFNGGDYSMNFKDMVIAMLPGLIGGIVFGAVLYGFFALVNTVAGTTIYAPLSAYALGIGVGIIGAIYKQVKG